MSREDRDAQLKDVYVVQPEIVRMEDSMEERGSRLAVVKGKMDRVEDEVFQDFCREIGVANIRCCLSSLLHPPPLHCYIHNCADTTIQPPHTQKPPHSHHHTATTHTETTTQPPPHTLSPPHRQYEERELQVQEERAHKRMEFEAHKMRLSNQLEFEKSRDTMC